MTKEKSAETGRAVNRFGAMPRDEVAGISTMPGERINCVDAALVLPQTRHQNFGVVDANGAPVVDALTFHKNALREIAFVDRDHVKPVGHLSGRYLFAGEYWSHFGHFLFESLSRMWALDHIDTPLDGIIFLSSRAEGEMNPLGMQAQIIRTLGIDLPVIMVSQPTEIEHLLVPRQAIGLGPLSSGTPGVRRFFQDRFRTITPRSGAERLYISRSGYQMRRGGVLAENHLEANLVAQGYTAFSPEKHSITDQIATYLGARQIVAPDSSALHLFGFVGRADQDLAIVLRRTDGAADMLPQITGFTGRKPLVIDSIQRIWSRDNARIPTWGHFAELDLRALGQALHAAGFIDDLSKWQPVKNWQLTKIRNFMERQLACTISISDPVRA